MCVPSRFYFTTLALLLLAAGCSKDEPKPAAPVEAPAATPTASADVRAAAKVNVTPTLGGKVFLVGEHPCELAVYADGRVAGLVFDASGNAVAPERVSEFSAALHAEGDVRPRVKLLWDAAEKRFRGQVEPRIELTTGPVDVTLELDGKAQSGVLEGYSLVPAASLQAEAHADATLPKAKPSAKLGAGAKAIADAKVAVPKLQSPNAAASIRARADAKLAVPKPKVEVATQASAVTEKKKKAGTSAGVKAKASFGFGN